MFLHVTLALYGVSTALYLGYIEPMAGAIKFFLGIFHVCVQDIQRAAADVSK